MYSIALITFKTCVKIKHWKGLITKSHNYNNMKKVDILKLLDGDGGNVPDVYFNPDQLARGIEIELEHTSNRQAAKIIAKVHILEHPLYYDYLYDMEEVMKLDGY